MDDRKEILHQLRNALNPIQTFLDVINTSTEDTQFQNFHQLCKESFNKVENLLKELEQP
ncbi:MAG: hypothetical protein Q7T03_00190 [Deltaproteobacteria bacterium]|nr:hypothetical protein [Deltaproteobacteria bacterium]